MADKRVNMPTDGPVSAPVNDPVNDQTFGQTEAEAFPGRGEPFFIDLGFSQRNRHGEEICGDAFKFLKNDDGRVIAVLSDGLGHGVKANILASMTATMALKFAAESTEGIVRAAEIMMSALPICQVRKISYATFTVVSAQLHGATRVVEMGNPQFELFRGGRRLELDFRTLESPLWNDRKMKVYNFEAEPQDRLVFFSDGISQSGMGSKSWPLGWRESGCAAYIASVLDDAPDISSHDLTERILFEACRKEPLGFNKDDMTAAAFYFRRPKRMILFTGPPYDPQQDRWCAELIAGFDGDRAIAGGTSAEIVSRQLGRPLSVSLERTGGDIPPSSVMEGIDLVTEGIFTLTKTAQYLDRGETGNDDNAAVALNHMLLRNDVIEILVGTRVNEAHQDPKLPQDIEIRRNIVKRIAETLKNKYIKTVDIKYV